MATVRKLVTVFVGACLGIFLGIPLVCISPVFVTGRIDLMYSRDPEIARQERFAQRIGMLTGISIGTVGGILVAILSEPDRRSHDGRG